MGSTINHVMSLVVGINLVLVGLIAFICLAVSLRKKKTTRLSVVITIVLGIAMVGYGAKLSLEFFNEKQPISIEARLIEDAEQKNKELPVMIDKNTRFESIYATGKVMNYKYVLVNVEANQVDKAILHNSIKETLISKMCSNETAKYFFDFGVSSLFHYYGNDGSLITLVDFTKNDCQKNIPESSVKVSRAAK